MSHMKIYWLTLQLNDYNKLNFASFWSLVLRPFNAINVKYQRLSLYWSFLKTVKVPGTSFQSQKLHLKNTAKCLSYDLLL